QSQKDTGALGVRMIDGGGNFLKESKRSFPFPSTAFYKLSGLAALFPASETFARYYLGQLDQYKNHEVGVLAGAYMMVDKKVLDKTGGFDERFFMYGEDIDLSFRIQNAGFKNIYFSEATIIHFKGESTKRGSLNYVRLFYGAMGLFVRKHYNRGFAKLYNLLIRMAIWVRGLISMGHSVTGLLGYRKEDFKETDCFVVAGKAQFDFISSVFQKNKTEQKIIGRINPGFSVEKDAIGNLQQLALLAGKQNIKEIIFGVDGFPAKEMITLMQELPKGMHFKFHFAGTFSIVGSNQRELQGDYMSIDGVG
ncbi:MAG: glycosyltransferase family 2 protein, partial [Ferruginibacter sp.]